MPVPATDVPRRRDGPLRPPWIPTNLVGMTAPLFVTADESLLDELLRLAAAAGTTPEVAHDASGALQAWLKAPLVLQVRNRVVL